MALSILYSPYDTDLRAQELEKEVQQVSRKLTAVESEPRWTNDDIKRKEDEHSKKHNNNLDMLKKCLEEKDRLHTKVINLANKVKEQENQLQHMDDESFVEKEGSRKGKRIYSKFSYSKREELQEPPK